MIRVGTRRSPLAQAQTDRVLAQLAPGVARKVLIESEGDKDQTTPVHHLDRPGAFTSRLTDAILAGEVDAAVHSLKDLPLRAPDEAPLVAILPRDDPADVLILRDASRDETRPLGLAPGSRVGTSAPRRQSQLLAADPQLVPIDVRGNVGTRLRLLEAGALDALLMAAAAFERMDLRVPEGASLHRLDPARFPGGPGQGTIAIQARAGTEAARVLAQLDHAPTRAAVEAERALLARFGGGCGLPLGAYARQEEGAWRLAATFADDGWAGSPRPRLRHVDVQAPLDTGAAEAVRLAHERITSLPDEPASPAPRPPAGKALAMTLGPSACQAYEDLLAAAGWRVVPFELIEDAPTGAEPPAAALEARWVAVASPRAAAHAARLVAKRPPHPSPRIAALGPATARALRSLGLPVHLVAPEGTGASLAEAIAAFPAEPEAVALPQAARALPDLEDGLRERGFVVHAWAAYDTRAIVPAPQVPRADAILVASPSNAEALAALPEPPSAPLVAFGPSTEAAMRRLGLPVHSVCPRRDASGILEVLP